MILYPLSVETTFSKGSVQHPTSPRDVFAPFPYLLWVSVGLFSALSPLQKVEEIRQRSSCQPNCGSLGFNLDPLDRGMNNPPTYPTIHSPKTHCQAPCLFISTRYLSEGARPGPGSDPTVPSSMRPNTCSSNASRERQLCQHPRYIGDVPPPFPAHSVTLI